MRHRIFGNRLNRHSSYRKATVRDIAKATLIRERICTTKAKAKEAKKLVDRLITLGKGGSLANRRHAFSILCDHKLVSDLFKNTSPRFKNRLGGYTRIVPLGNRRGDNAQLVLLELTEKKEIIMTKPKSTATAKKDVPEAKPSRKSALQKGEESKEQKETKAQIQEATKVQEEAHEEVKEQTQKKDFVKEQKQKPTEKGKGKSAKGFVGNLRKMFQRKSFGR